jgi:glycerophosphoryl diester phosphodiesterase
VLLVASVEVLELAREHARDLPRMLDIEIPAGWIRHPERLSAVGPARALENRWAAIGRPRFTLGGWRIYRRVIRRDLEEIREGIAKGNAPVDHYVCWTINRPREMRRLIRMGVHGILTDHARVLERIVRRPTARGS